MSIETQFSLFELASGAGFVIDANGHIVTNAHVVEDALTMIVLFHDGSEASAALIGIDPLVDIAVIKVDVEHHRLEPVDYGNSDDLAVGQSVLAIGNPFGLEGTLTTGIISGLDRSISFGDGSTIEGAIQTDAALGRGNSGGPLLNQAGEVIGVNTAGYTGPSGSSNFGFAIPSNTVQRISKTMIAQKIDRSHIGKAVRFSTPKRDKVAVSTPIVSTPQSQSRVPTSTPDPTATRFQPTVAVRQDLIVEQIPPPVFAPTTSSTLGASAYQFNVGAQQLFSFENLRISGGVVLFAPNPRGADSYLRTDQVGLLFYRPVNATGESTMVNAPFHEGFLVPSSDANKNRVVEIDWSADGTQFTFRIDTPPGQYNGNAGVWFWQPVIATSTDPTYQVIRDCVRAGYNPCRFVNPSNAQFWKTIDVAWSPVHGSNSLLLTLQLTGEGRNALAVVQAVRDAEYANQAPEFFRYDFGHWNANGNGIIVSGRRHDGRVVIAEVNSDLHGERIIFDATAAGLWVQDAVRRPNGQIIALGRPGGPHDNAPVALYDQYGRRLSGSIGGAAPDAARWYPQRDFVVVTVQGRQYTVQVDGGLITDSTDLIRNPSFGTGNVGVAPIPSAVIQSSEYQPGEQLRIVQGLSIHQAPSTGAQFIGGLIAGDYVAIIAGPYDNEGYRWWRVQTANNVLGWIAGVIDRVPTLRRP